MKKLLAMLLCFTVAFCAFGCGPEKKGDDETTTVINIPYSTGGLGKDWITGPGQRFSDLKATTSYAEGKMGVKVNAVEYETRSDTINSNAFEVVIFDRQSDPSTMGALGSAIDITDVVTQGVSDVRNGVEYTIEDKLDPAFADYYKSFDGTKFYAVPFMEYYGGLTYDPVTYINKGLYIAACNVTGKNDAAFELERFGEEFVLEDDVYTNTLGVVKHESQFGIDLYLAAAPDAYTDVADIPSDLLSVGPNGIAQDYDDGLCSSVYELIALCDYMKMNNLATPFALSGKHPNYSNMFGDGLFHSLAGNYDGYSIMSLDTEGREVEVVTGWTTEKLFPGIQELEHLLKPTTAKVAITEATGYYTSWMLARYWAAVVQDIAYSMGWFVPGLNSTSVDHIMTQKNFIFGNYSPNPDMPATAFLMEGSFWNNESRIRGNYNELYDAFYPLNNRDVKWCPLPVTIDIPVTGEIIYTNEEKGYYDAAAYALGFAGHAPTIVDVTRSYMMINSNIANNPEKLAAAKDLIRFYMTDAELTWFAVEAGCFKPMKYDIDFDLIDGNPAWNTYMQSLWDVRGQAKVIYYEGNNATFDAYGTLFQRGYASGAMSTNNYLSYIQRREKTKNFHTFWEETIKTMEGWKTFYAGDPANVTLVNGVDYTAYKMDNKTPYKNWDNPNA